MDHEQQTETVAQRAERWAAESASAKPPSRIAGVTFDLLPRALAGAFALGALGVIGYVAVDVAHRGDPGGVETIGWVTASTCFTDDPADYFTGTEELGALPTADCDDEHRAEAFLSYDLALARSKDPAAECAQEWARQSDVTLGQSGIELTFMVKTTDNSPYQVAVCVAVASEPVEGRQLTTWQPSGPGDVEA